jgi:hypothetical protein
VFVAGSRPAGHAPEYPPSSSTVSDPPGFGVPVAAVEVADDDVELDADADADEVDDFELEPHALTIAAIRNRQAAIAASLLVRMAWLIPALLA